MSGKNSSFVADLAAGVEPVEARGERGPRIAGGVLAGRNSRLADLASGSVIDHPQELVDPARCRIWDRHNRDYGALNETRCGDLIDSIKAQGRQEVPAIVRRITNDPDCDFEVICGARRHWTVTWLRAHNYPDIRYLIEIRKLTDEQAFRISDIENRAREDLSDVERARDYLRALELYYSGKQKSMAERLNQSEAWLSRYLDLARLPDDLMLAFADPLELKISHIVTLKPILKAEKTRGLVLAEAQRLALLRNEGAEGALKSVPDVLRALVSAASAPKVGTRPAPKKTGSQTLLQNDNGVPLVRVDKKTSKEVSVTLMVRAGGTRAQAETALKQLLIDLWPV